MATPPKTQDELNALIAANPKIAPIEAPQFFASNFNLAITPTAFTLICARTRPAYVGEGNQMTLVGTVEPVAILHLSPGSVKDLSLLLTDNIAQFEQNYGKVETDFTRKRATEAAEAAKAAKAK